MRGCACVHVPVVVGKMHIVEGGDQGGVELLLVRLMMAGGILSESGVGLREHAGARSKNARGRCPPSSWCWCAPRCLLLEERV